jgi:polyisoprenoid-binding protein YceI
MATWKIDPDHSVAAFAINHFMITDVRGQFNQVGGTVLFDPTEPFGAALDVEVGIASLLTGVGKRDDHLKSPDFLDAARYPLMTFAGKAIQPVTLKSGRIAGILHLHGVSRELALDAEFLGPVTGPEDFGGETSIGFTLTGRLDREDFGLTWNRAMKGGGMAVGREVRLFIHLEADLAGE